VGNLLTELWDKGQDLLGLKQAYHQDLQWSSEARALLENPLLQRFFSETEQSFVDQWKGTQPNQKAEREVAYQLLTLSRKFKIYFETFLANEEYARQQLAEMEKE
jgi:hypothetical protein